MIIQPYEYSLYVLGVVSFHLVPHLVGTKVGCGGAEKNGGKQTDKHYTNLYIYIYMAYALKS